MRTLFTFLCVFAAALGLSVTSTAQNATGPGFGAWTSPELPLEVIGPDQTVETFTIFLPSGAGSATNLFLKINHLSFEKKASVRVNGGRWRTLNNRNVVMPRKDVGFWGMGGIQDTLRMTVRLQPGEIINGTNRVEFRFNDLDGISIGYRVLEVNLHSGTGPLLPPEAFTHTDPSTWRPPINTDKAKSEGRALWYSAPITEHGRAMNVHCTDCHAHDGRDLKYFNFSNRSIVERAIFHGMTREEGLKVASYIRSLNVPYEPLGRPWNPAYQPGPGLDSRPVRSWAAGAGLDAVVENDLDTLRYLFPDGITTNALDVESRIVNAREIPMSVQMPTWNQWLPRKHPLDQNYPVYSTNSYVLQYGRMRSSLAGKTGLQAAQYIRGQSSNWDSKTDDVPFATPPPTTNAGFPEWSANRRDKLLWRSVKTWEMMTEFQVEDYGHELFGALSAGGSPTSDRRWFAGEIFRLGPHVRKGVRDKKFFAESMQWYELQLILHDGNRVNPNIVPIDWGYLHALNQSSWNNRNNTLTYGILVLNVIKGLEVSANGLGAADDNGWNYTKCDLHRLAPGKTMATKYAMIPIETRRAVAEACISEWLKHSLRYTREEYAARKNFSFTDVRRNYIRDLAVNFAAIGVRPDLVNGICEFGERLFPTYDWNQHRL